MMTNFGKIIGLLEGEGSLSISLCKKRLTPSIEFSNTDKELIDFWKKEYPYFNEYSSFSKRKLRYKLMLRKYEKIQRFLLEVKSSLISSRKKKLADLVLEFIKIRLSKKKQWYGRGRKGNGTTYGQREYEIYKEVKSLNLKGRKRRK